MDPESGSSRTRRRRSASRAKNRFNAGSNFSNRRVPGSGLGELHGQGFWTDVLDRLPRLHRRLHDGQRQLRREVGRGQGDDVAQGHEPRNEDIQQHIFGDIMKRTSWARCASGSEAPRIRRPLITAVILGAACARPWLALPSGRPRTRPPRPALRDGHGRRDRPGRDLAARQGRAVSPLPGREPRLAQQASALPAVLPVDTRVLAPGAVSQELERLQPQLDRLVAAGVNVVRLLVMWKGIEPVYQGAVSIPPARGPRLSGRRPRGGGRAVRARHPRHPRLPPGHRERGLRGRWFPDWALAVDRDHPRPAAPPKPNAWWGIRYYARPGDALSKAVRHTLQSF